MDQRQMETLRGNDLDSAYDGPPDYRVIGRHAVFPETSHDEIERINFLAQMNRHLAARVVPGVRAAYDSHVSPKFASEHGRPIADRHEARKAMLDDPTFRTTERALWTQEYLARILRIVQQESEAAVATGDITSESVGDEITRQS